MDLPTDHNIALAHQDVKGFHLLWLLLVLTIALAVRTEFFVGCLGTDDLVAWNRAAQFSQGHWSSLGQNFNIVATLRYGLSLPVAGLFALFGVSETSANMFPLLMSLLAVAAVWDLTRRLTGSLTMACIAALWLAVVGLDISYSTVLLPDGPLSSLGVLCMWAMVVAIRRPDGKQVGTSALFFVSGFLAGYAISVKLPGIGLIATLSLWSVSSLILRQWRSKMWWALCGFVLAVVLEHLFFWVVHGDPLYRWHTIPGQLEQYRQQMVAGALVPDEQDLSYYSGHVSTWLATFARVSPGAALTITATLIASLYLLIARWRDEALRLLVCFVIVFIIFRIPEFMKTYSFQPRRMLPLAALGPVVTLAALWCISPWHIRGAARPVLPIVIGLAVVLSVTLLLSGPEKPHLRKLHNKVAVERDMWSWIKNHEAEVEREGFFTDHRSLRTVNALCGFQLAKRNVHTYPAYWQVADGKIIEPEPPLYNPVINLSGPASEPSPLDRGYWGINPRVIRWLWSKRTMNWLRKRADDVPGHWTLEKVTGIPEDVYANNGGIFKIRPLKAKKMTLTPPWLSLAGSMQGNTAWHVYPPETRVNPMETVQGIEVVAAKGSRSRLISPKVAWNKEGSGFDGDFLLSVVVSSPRADVESDARVYLRLDAYDEKNQPIILHKSWKKNTELSAGFNAYVRKPASAKSLQVKFYFYGTGTYHLGQIFVLPAASSSLDS